MKYFETGIKSERTWNKLVEQKVTNQTFKYLICRYWEIKLMNV